MSVRSKIQVRKFFLIVLAWTVIGLLQTVYDHFVMTSHMAGGLAPGTTFWDSLILNGLSGLMGGSMGGAVLIYIVRRRFRAAPYYKAMLVVCGAFVVIVSFITFTFAIGQTYATHKSLSSPEAVAAMKELVLTTQHLKNLILWATVVGFTQLTLMLDDKFGQGLLWNMIRGKYHLPKTENRIFMFLDLRSSTSIAEKLGDEQYHQLLKDLFAHITDPILENQGEIYQYVGDEVVISWNIKDGLENGSCVNCFLDIKAKLKSRKQKYIDRYDLEPQFKAGIHFGKVVAGEIGIIKRDITYSGDVLNTTARIQSQCNDLNVDLLMSKSLKERLEETSKINPVSVGSINLRGKENEMELFTVG